MFGARHFLWRGACDGVWTEGPHIYKNDGRYYLMIAEGGTSFNHAVMVAASDKLTGPYVSNPRNPIFTSRQLWIKIFPDKPITKKPLEVRMGKGKGAVELWVAVCRPGRVLFEVGGVPLDVAKEALRLAAQKLPVKTKFLIARDYEA